MALEGLRLARPAGAATRPCAPLLPNLNWAPLAPRQRQPCGSAALGSLSTCPACQLGIAQQKACGCLGDVGADLQSWANSTRKKLHCHQTRAAAATARRAACDLGNMVPVALLDLQACWNA